jgi:hypothetical protein
VKSFVGVVLALQVGCTGTIGGSDPDGGVALDGDGAVISIDAGAEAGDADVSSCPASGPAYVHGDLWPYWHNYRVACDRQHKWLWICEQRLGSGNCPAEQQRFDECWTATGDFPASTWEGSTPSPSSPNYGVCQPVHWAEKNDPNRRPGNPVPCDTTQNDYDVLRTSDPRYGVDWWAGSTSMRHLTVKVFQQGDNPQDNNGQADGIVNLSTHPGDQSAFMNNLSNHSYGGNVLGGGCLPALTGDGDDPWPAQNVGSFYWLEVPTDRVVTLTATWIGPIGDDIGTACLGLDVYGFPGSFSYHSVDDKPWFITSPCWDAISDVQLQAGHHYAWDVQGFTDLGCTGPTDALLSVVPEPERPTLRDGTCSSM